MCSLLLQVEAERPKAPEWDPVTSPGVLCPGPDCVDCTAQKRVEWLHGLASILCQLTSLVITFAVSSVILSDSAGLSYPTKELDVIVERSAAASQQSLALVQPGPLPDLSLASPLLVLRVQTCSTAQILEGVWRLCALLNHVQRCPGPSTLKCIPSLLSAELPRASYG